MPRRLTPTVDPATTAAENGYGPALEADELRPDICNTPAPWGVRCSSDAFHDGRHSWQSTETDVELAEAASPNGSVAQSELPGTPAVESDEFAVPFESSFAGADLKAASGLKAIAERLIATESSFDHLQGIELRYFWKRRGGLQGGNPRFGGIKRPSGFDKYFSGGTTVYFVWLAADHVRDVGFTPEQIEACLFSQLCRTDVDPDDHDAYRLVGPDFTGFVRELERYGVWNRPLLAAARRISQLPLDALLAEADDDDSDDDAAEADGEEDEGEQS